MVQLSGGGDSSSGTSSYGEELGGDPVDEPEPEPEPEPTTVDDASGGIDGPDTQDSSTDDSGPTETRRLRRGARSDPMVDATEPEPSPTPDSEQTNVNTQDGSIDVSDVDSGGGGGSSSSGTSEPSTDQGPSRGSGSGGPSPEDVSDDLSPEGTSATIPEPDSSPPSDNEPSPSDVQPDQGSTDTSGSQSSGGGSTTTSPGGTSSGSGGGGSSNGGTTDTREVVVINPDGSQTTKTVPTDSDLASTVRKTESGEFIGASAPGQDPGETRAPSGGAGTTGTTVATGTVSGQGIETGGPGSGGNFQTTIDGETITGSKQDIAQAAEAAFLEENPEFSNEDVRVVASDTGLAIELTGSGEDVALDEAMTEALNRRAAEGNAINVGQVQETTEAQAAAQQELEIQIQEALEGTGFYDDRAQQRQALREEIEQDIEGQVGSQRAERAGIVNPTLRENVVGNTDLQPGEDFTLEFGEPTTRTEELPDGGTREITTASIEVELTDAFRQAEAERAFRRALWNETGVELDIGEDFRAVSTGDGGFEAEITETGQEEVRRNQPEQFGDIDWSAVFGIDTAPTDLTDEEITEEDLRRSGIDPSTVLRPAGDPEVDEVEVALRDASAAISDAGREFASGLFDDGGVASESLGEEILIAAGREDLGRQYEESLRGFGKGLAQSPFALANVPALAGAVLEGVEYGQYATEQEVGRTYQQTKDRAIEVGEAAYGEIIERPAEFAGLAVGTLGASYGIMRAAASVGPKTGLAARYAIQPGEELAGSIGFRTTRAIANERRAQQLFPNREPLIFSEEAAIRTAKRLRARVDVDVSATRARAADLVLGEPETKLVRSGSSEIEGFEESRLVTERPGPLSQARAGASRLEDAFAGRAFAGVPIARRSELETRSASVEAETETLLDELEGPLSRMERAQERRAQATRDRVRNRFEVEENPLRSRAREGRLLTETDTEADALQRTEIAQQPMTEPLGSRLATRVTGRQTLQQDVFGIQSEIDRSELFQETRTETETELEQEFEQELETEIETELAFETETETFLDLEMELELESEFETEFEFEFEPDNEVEIEPFGDRGDRRDDDDPGGLFAESRTLLERDLLNPFTGR